MKKNGINTTINAFKGIACIGVVFIHIKFPGKLGDIIMVISGFAVPFFFLVSGFYSYNKNSCIIMRRTKKIAKILLCALCFYGIVYFNRGYHQGEVGKYVSNVLTPENLLKVFFLGDFSLINGTHLWFLHALIWAYIFLYIVDWLGLDRFFLKWYVIAIVLLLKESMLFLISIKHISWRYAGNFLFCAIPYLLLGRYLAANISSINKLKNRQIITGIIVGVLFCLMWAKFIYVDDQIVGTVFYSTAIFIFAIKNPQLKLGPFAYIGERYSLFIYIMHIYIISLFYKYVFDPILCNISINNHVNDYIRPIIGVALSLLGAVVFVFIKDNINKIFTYIKYKSN
ncbi:MAG: acyltransferase [Lachnospiraceae bacterium]|nr:acyltransferase [Lachnospiraceae bacterium]